MPMLYRLEVFDHLLALFQPDVGLLPVARPAGAPADPADLAVLGFGPHAGDLRPEQLFDGGLDLDLVGVPGDLEADLPVLVLEPCALLGDHGAEEDPARVFAHFNLSITAAKARRLKTSQG